MNDVPQSLLIILQDIASSFLGVDKRLDFLAEKLLDPGSCTNGATKPFYPRLEDSIDDVASPG